ncbi:hypothetical protein SLEP1_g53421 [Rubroshorea leprosula]|uniref:Uncharacterized protein n=1 Tax=Rubroshorea leprosula TaxID=152421 RepID=A0AAV5MD88_9ROSI|nr:hypothetical protein SLEP1_g53420 [Rubroshorea leprosula]GKV46437.1 hypothetical protein SLEP1_g53421 [Rubroshorea leprosula]
MASIVWQQQADGFDSNRPVVQWREWDLRWFDGCKGENKGRQKVSTGKGKGRIVEGWQWNGRHSNGRVA